MANHLEDYGLTLLAAELARRCSASSMRLRAPEVEQSTSEEIAREIVRRLGSTAEAAHPSEDLPPWVGRFATDQICARLQAIANVTDDYSDSTLLERANKGLAQVQGMIEDLIKDLRD